MHIIVNAPGDRCGRMRIDYGAEQYKPLFCDARIETGFKKKRKKGEPRKQQEGIMPRVCCVGVRGHQEGFCGLPANCAQTKCCQCGRPPKATSIMEQPLEEIVACTWHDSAHALT